jgi:hypothetical protein
MVTVKIAREGRGECDARGSKDERKVEAEDLKSREEVKGENNWCCKHDEPYRLVDV